MDKATPVGKPPRKTDRAKSVLRALPRREGKGEGKRLAVAICALLWLQPARAQVLKWEEITSAYVYNFAKNIEWPEENRISEFRFLIISDNPALNREMRKMAGSVKLKGRPIRIVVSGSVAIPEGMHLVYVTRGLRDLAAAVFLRIEGRNMLLVTDGFEDKRMVMINLFETKEKTIKFEINKANIINQGLKVLPDMVLLGGTEIDVAQLYKESQDTLRIKEDRIAELRQRLDSINAEIDAANREIGGLKREIGGLNRLIARQDRNILEQRDRLGRQRDSLSRQAGLLRESRRILKLQQDETESGRKILSVQRAKIESQGASIRAQRKVLEEQSLTIAVQRNIQRFLIGAIVLVLGLSYAIYRGYRGKKLSNRRLQEREGQIRELNRDLRQRAASLEDANKELEAFSYSVSHDLRAPLRSIDGFSQAVMEDYGKDIDDRGKDYLRRVRSAAQRMAQLIDDLLDLSRVTRSGMTPGEIDLSAMVRDIADRMRSQQPGREVEFLVQGGLSAWGDERLLRIAMENLIDNAWKYTSKHPTARIEFGSRAIDGKRVFFLKDDGAGFAMAYAQNLFGAFQRLHTVEEFPGTGVGLATVRRIVHRHGGRIWAEGEVEKGATFYFFLPGKQE